MWDPVTYPATIRSEVHDYDQLQARVAEATVGVDARAILDLGIGAGETARRVLEIHPMAQLVGIDSSAEMLKAAAQALPRGRVKLLQQDLMDPLPDQHFDVVISALAIHHLQGGNKADLFRRVAKALTPRGRLVVGDVIILADPADALIDAEPGYDFPSTIDDHLQGMNAAGISTTVVWAYKDLAVFSGDVGKAMSTRPERLT